MKGKLRVTSGRLRGRYIKAHASEELRPTTERVRESLFSILETRGLVEGAYVLDLFSGSGILGFESLSRGAKFLCSVEKHRSRSAIIKESAQELGLSKQCRVFCKDVFGFIATAEVGIKYSLVFVDPPYRQSDPIFLWLSNSSQRAPASSWISCWNLVCLIRRFGLCLRLPLDYCRSRQGSLRELGVVIPIKLLKYLSEKWVLLV